MLKFMLLPCWANFNGLFSKITESSNTFVLTKIYYYLFDSEQKIIAKNGRLATIENNV